MSKRPVVDVGGVKVRVLPSLKEIEKCYYLDREVWRLRNVPLVGNDKVTKEINRMLAHQIAGCETAQGYRRVCMLGSSFPEHRMIWKMHYGVDPVGVIDHINGIRDDNRIKNLRDVTLAQNNMNAVRDRWAAETRWRKRGMDALKAKAKEARRVKREQRLSVGLAPHLGCLVSC